MMNGRARQLGLRDTHFTRPDGLDAPGHVSSARDVTKLARVVMRRPRTPRARRDANSDDLGRSHALHLERPARLLPRPRRREDGSHVTAPGGPRSRPPGRAGSRCTRRSSAARRASSGTATSRGSSPGACRGTAMSPVVSSGRTYATATTGYGRGTVPLVATRPAHPRRPVGPPAGGTRRRPASARAPGRSRRARGGGARLRAG